MTNKKVIQVPPADSMGIYENIDNKLLISVPDARVQLMRAICDGTVEKNVDIQADILTPAWNPNFNIYYQSRIPTMDTQPVDIKVGEPVGRISTIKVGGLKEIRGFYFWATYKGERINPLLVLTKNWLSWLEPKEKHPIPKKHSKQKKK